MIKLPDVVTGSREFRIRAGRQEQGGIQASIGGPSRWHALVLAMAMLAGCETRAPKNSGGARILTDAEMIRITAGAAVAVNQATAHAVGTASQTAVSATTQTYSDSNPSAGGPLLNYAASQATASARSGDLAQAGLSSQISVNGGNGGVRIDTGASGDGTNRTLVRTQTYGISTSTADLVFGSVSAVACCGTPATAQVNAASEAGGQYSRELRSVVTSDTPEQIQRTIDIAIVSSAFPILDPAQVLVMGGPARVSPKY